MNSPHFEEKVKKNKAFDDNLNKKLGLLSLSDILYKKERFQEAFANIKKAVAMVLQEKEIESKDTEAQRIAL